METFKVGEKVMILDQLDKTYSWSKWYNTIGTINEVQYSHVGTSYTMVEHMQENKGNGWKWSQFQLEKLPVKDSSTDINVMSVI